MATPEEINDTLSQLREGLLQLAEAVKSTTDVETDAEKHARLALEEEKRNDVDRENIRRRQRVADEAAINEELKNLGLRKKSSGETEKLEDTHRKIIDEVNKAIRATGGAFALMDDAAIENWKTTERQNAAVTNQIESIKRQIETSVALTATQYQSIAATQNALKEKQREIELQSLAATVGERQAAAFEESIFSIEKQTASLFEYDATQADAIRTANMALKEKQREVEASKNLGDVSLRQKESFQETIGKLKNQLDSTVKLTDQQYKEINAVEQSIRIRNKEINEIKNAGKNLADMVGRVKDVGSALEVLKEKQLAAAEGNATATAGIIAKFQLFNIGLGLATNAFDLLVAGIKGYYEGILATQRALYAGERGEKLAQAANIAMYKAMAAQAKSSGDSLINLGKEAAAAGVAISFMIPGSFLFKAGIAAAGLAVGGLTAAMGAAEKVAGELAERQAEVLEMYAEQMDALFNGFSELGKASMIGARGMEGLYDNLHKVGFTVKEFDKLNKVLQANSRDMKMFGVTASNGVDKFVEVASGLVYGELGHTLRMMGISTEEMLDHQAKYMAQQARFGMLQNKSIDQLIKGTSDYIIELDKTAALTGASRKDQEESMKYVMANEKLRAGMLVEEEKAKRTGDYTVLKQMQQAANLASKLYDAGQKRAATGAAEYYGAGKKVTGLESAEFAATFKATIRDLNEGRKSDTTLYLQSTKEAYDAAGRVAGSRRYGANTEGLLGDTTQSIVDARKLTQSIEQAAKERGIKEGTPEFEKLVKELGQRAATDKNTAEQVAKREAARDAALKQDDAVRNKDLSAIIGDLGKPANMMVNAGNSMLSAGKSILDAGKYMWNATFGGEKGEAENLTRNIMVKDEAITEASERVDLAKKKLEKKNLSDKEKKEAEEDLKVWTDQVAMLKKQKAQMVEERRIHQDISAIQKQRDEKQSEITKQTQLRKETLLLKQNKEKAEEMAKYDKEVASGTRRSSASERTAKEQALNKRFQDELKKLDNDTNAAYRNIADSNEIKEKIANLNNELKELKLKGPSTGSAQTFGGGKTASGGTIGLAGGSAISSSNEQLKEAGLRLKSGDVQKEGSKVDPKLLEIAKQAQANIPGFLYFSAFNDNFHQEKSPTSKHTDGLAFDFTVNPGRGKTKPSKEDSDNIIKMLKDMGVDSVINEYDNPSSKATGGHFHAELAMPKAYDGGLFDGPKAGYPVELHGREAIVPLPDPSSKISVETTASAAAKAPLNSILTSDNNSSSAMSNMSAQILEDLYNLMEDKFDSMIATIKDGNDISDKLLKYSRV